MNLRAVSEISQILERDSKDATYKFALLRAVIESIQDYPQLKYKLEDQIVLPIGLLVEKWLIYYYPIFADTRFIPQKNGEHEDSGPGIAFRPDFSPLIEFYENRGGGLARLFLDLTTGQIPEEIQEKVFHLLKKIRDTIIRMPMKYIGYSVHKDHYKVFTPLAGNRRRLKGQQLDALAIRQNFGEFSIPEDYYNAFYYFGSFIKGTDSILMKWAEFTAGLDKTASITTDYVLRNLLVKPLSESDVADSKKIYLAELNKNGLKCVWSDAKISLDHLAIDHCIPFSYFYNNDLWNLLPTRDTINGKKSSKIPSEQLLLEREKAIKSCWEMAVDSFKDRFLIEMTRSLTGTIDDLSVSNIFKLGFNRLIDRCRYLTDIRGMEVWNG